jgi:hypothetical protein
MNTRRATSRGQKLVLARETLRALSPEDLAGVVGGSYTYLPEGPDPENRSIWTMRCPGVSTRCTTVVTQVA